MLNKTFFATAALSVVAGSALVACGGSDDISVATPTPLAEPFTIEVMGFNDYHGTLESPGTFGGTTAAPAASRPVVGGAEFMAAHITSLKILTFRSSPSLLKFSIPLCQTSCRL